MTLNSSRNPGNNNYPINTSGLPIVIGKHSWGSTRFAEFYLAEIHCSDGYKYTPSDYGETDAGNWTMETKITLHFIRNKWILFEFFQIIQERLQQHLVKIQVVMVIISHQIILR